jgi:hypothetical protein
MTLIKKDFELLWDDKFHKSKRVNTIQKTNEPNEQLYFIGFNSKRSKICNELFDFLKEPLSNKDIKVEIFKNIDSIPRSQDITVMIRFLKETEIIASLDN